MRPVRSAKCASHSSSNRSLKGSGAFCAAILVILRATSSIQARGASDVPVCCLAMSCLFMLELLVGSSRTLHSHVPVRWVSNDRAGAGGARRRRDQSGTLEEGFQDPQRLERHANVAIQPTH